MDEREAIELLKGALAEIPHLTKLHHDNQEYELWRDKVIDIIKAGLDADDESRFCRLRGPIHVVGHWTSDADYQRFYLENLGNHVTALKSIIQKHEIDGMSTSKPQVVALRFSNRTLSCIIDILADGYSDSGLRNFFFKYNLLDVYEQSGRLTAKRRKVTDVFQHLCESRDENSVSTLESIVREALRKLYPRADSDQGRREHFFQGFPDLDVALRADGYQMREGELVPVISPLVEVVEEEGLIEKLLEKYGFAIAKNHLKQSYENYIGGKWEAANGALRSFLQDVFDQIALIVVPQKASGKPAGGERRKLLQQEGFIEDDTEAKLVSSFFKFASQDGSHPGISNESDCRLRRYMAVALASYYLEKLEKLKARND